MGKTHFKLAEQHRDRWNSYGSGTGITHISERLSPQELKEYPIFETFSEKFLERLSPDVSIAVWKEGSVLFEAGSYIDIAFNVVDGEVGLHLNQEGRDDSVQPIFDHTRTTIFPTESQPETTQVPRLETVFFSHTEMQDARHPAFLSTLDMDMPAGDMLRLGKGEIFGEIGALNGWPQSVTARTSSNCTLVQIRVPALRRMREKSPDFKEWIDSLYRKRSLFGQLKASPLFGSCSDEFLAPLAKKVDLISCRPDEVVVEEGASADALYLVRSGFMKFSQRMSAGDKVLSYVSKGMTFGEVEMLIAGVENWKFTVSSVGYSELVKISSADLSDIMAAYPEIEKELWQQAAARLKESGPSNRNAQRSEFTQFSLENGLVEGNSILVIDLNECTRCDDCVRACADTHGGQPRFVREGDRYANMLIAKACYHCQDPVCLIGCPTGAIRRANVGDVVEIREDICIGCSHCAENCPYDAIVMQDSGTQWSDDAVPKSLRGQDRMMASKCDLCYSSSLGPACVRNCPQGCAYRVGSIEEFQSLLDR